MTEKQEFEFAVGICLKYCKFPGTCETVGKFLSVCSKCPIKAQFEAAYSMEVISDDK